MRVKPERNRSKLIAAAMKKIPCDLTVKNIKFVNVITGEIYPAEVDILEGIVVCVREEGNVNPLKSLSEYDAGGRYMIPGYIDIHMHVESTMMIPENFGKAAVKCGTTSVFVDPHEIGNVLGIEGVRIMIENARRSPVRQFNLAPSCVPSVPGVEGNGASFTSREISDLLAIDGVYGIAEVMDFINVINDDVRMREICETGLEKNVLIQGHCPGLRGSNIAAYHLAGPTDSHCMDCEEDMKAVLRSGMYADMQESSMSPRRMDRLVRGLQGMRYTDHVCLCNDDVHAKDLLETGHVNRLVKSALLEGVHPVDAVRWSTFNSARNAGIEDLGAIAPGYVADFQLIDELDGRNPYAVFMEGRIVVENGELVEKSNDSCEFSFPNTVNLGYIISSDIFQIHTEGNDDGFTEVAVIDYDVKGGRSALSYEKLPVKNGKVDISGRNDLHYIAVFNRHGCTDHVVALAKGWGLERGCLASTVGHDSHNVILMYYRPEDALIACKALEKCGGGLCAVDDGAVTGLLELPVAGLMSLHECEDLVPAIAAVEEAFRAISPKRKMMEMAVNSLACMPSIVITDRVIMNGRTLETFPVIRK